MYQNRRQFIETGLKGAGGLILGGILSGIYAPKTYANDDTYIEIDPFTKEFVSDAIGKWEPWIIDEINPNPNKVEEDKINISKHEKVVYGNSYYAGKFFPSENRIELYKFLFIKDGLKDPKGVKDIFTPAEAESIFHHELCHSGVDADSSNSAMDKKSYDGPSKRDILDIAVRILSGTDVKYNGATYKTEPEKHERMELMRRCYHGIRRSVDLANWIDAFNEHNFKSLTHAYMNIEKIKFADVNELLKYDISSLNEIENREKIVEIVRKELGYSGKYKGALSPGLTYDEAIPMLNNTIKKISEENDLPTEDVIKVCKGIVMEKGQNTLRTEFIAHTVAPLMSLYVDDYMDFKMDELAYDIFGSMKLNGNGMFMNALEMSREFQKEVSKGRKPEKVRKYLNRIWPRNGFTLEEDFHCKPYSIEDDPNIITW